MVFYRFWKYCIPFFYISRVISINGESFYWDVLSRINDNGVEESLLFQIRIRHFLCYIIQQNSFSTNMHIFRVIQEFGSLKYFQRDNWVTDLKFWIQASMNGLKHKLNFRFYFTFGFSGNSINFRFTNEISYFYFHNQYPQQISIWF